jgi:hypothetical protein
VGETVQIVQMRATLRCVMTAHRQADLVRDLRILRTAAQHHHNHIGVWASIGIAGTVRVGDPVVFVRYLVSAHGARGYGRPEGCEDDMTARAEGTVKLTRAYSNGSSRRTIFGVTGRDPSPQAARWAPMPPRHMAKKKSV